MTTPTRRSKLAWTGAGAGVVALCAAAAIWVANDGQHTATPAPVIAAAPVAPPALALPAPAKAPADLSAPAEAVLAAPVDDSATPSATPLAKGGADPDVSTAAILEDVTEPAPPADKEKTLKEILQASTPATVAATGVSAAAAAAAAPKLAANPAPDELTRLLDKPTPRAPLPTAARKSPKRMVEAAKPPVKLAAQKPKQKDTDKHRLAVAPSKKKEVHPKASSSQVDSDVALLAALVAHSKAYPEKIKPGSTAAKLKQCGKQSGANAGKCRERVCNGSGKDDLECKSVRLAKATVVS